MIGGDAGDGGDGGEIALDMRSRRQSATVEIFQAAEEDKEVAAITPGD